jgi:hypothetical protein
MRRCRSLMSISRTLVEWDSNPMNLGTNVATFDQASSTPLLYWTASTMMTSG